MSAHAPMTDNSTPTDPYARARARWPGLDVSREAFEHHIALAAPADALHVEDLYLALACGRGDSAALEALEESILSQIGGPLRSLTPTAEFAEEVRQRLRTRLLVGEQPTILKYRGRGPLVAWVNVSAIRLGLTLIEAQRRQQTREVGHWSAALLVADTGDPEVDACKRQNLEAFRAALTEACEALPERDRALLRMHFVDGLGIDRVSTIYGVHRATAARWIVKAKDALSAGARTRLSAALGVTDKEAETVARSLRSQIEFGLSQLLPEGP